VTFSSERAYTGQAGQPVGLPFLLVCALLLLCVPSGIWGAPVRGLWVVRHDISTPDRARQVVETAARAGLTTLFVQVRGRGDAYYRSTLVPIAEDVEEGFDPLKTVLALAQNRGMTVHVWFNVYLTWHQDRRPESDSHVLATHPEWFATSGDGIDMGASDLTTDLRSRGVEGRYLSPSSRGAQRHLLAVLNELLRSYRVDGIHLDYVRYPNEHYDFSPAAVGSFTRAYRSDPRASDDASRRAWMAWRSDQVTQFVQKVNRLCQQIRPEIRVSAAVKPDMLRAYQRYGQDWVRWLNRRYVDFVVPMFYVGSLDKLTEQMEAVRRFALKGYVLAGIGAWNQGITDTLGQAERAIATGLDGYVIFSYRTLIDQPELVSALADRFGRGQM
jgi:uncharacterized lipoprotein YddW (UPF0748 family)